MTNNTAPALIAYIEHLEARLAASEARDARYSHALKCIAEPGNLPPPDAIVCYALARAALAGDAA